MYKLIVVSSFTFILGLTVGAQFFSSTAPYLSNLEQSTSAKSTVKHDFPRDTEIIESQSMLKSRDEQNVVSITDDMTDEIQKDTKQEDPQENTEYKRIQELKERLSFQMKRNAELQNKFSYAQQLLKENNIPFETVSLEEIADLIPKDYLKFFGASEHLKQFMKDMMTEEKDDSWAFETEQQISDFIILHENGSQLSNVSVACRSSICEIKGFEQGDGHFARVMEDLAKQPWWKFNRSSSTSGLTGPDGKFFYKIISKR